MAGRGTRRLLTVSSEWHRHSAAESSRCRVMADVVMADIVMAYLVIADMVIAYIVMGL